MGLRVTEAVYRVQGSAFKPRGLGFKTPALELGVLGLGLEVTIQGSVARKKGCRFRPRGAAILYGKSRELDLARIVCGCLHNLKFLRPRR